MSRRILCGLIAVGAVIAIAGFAAPAGDSQPPIVRIVTIGDRTGPAYYSQVEQGYRFVGKSPAGTANTMMTGNVSEPVTALVTAEITTN